jgi:PKD repeat protein
MRPTEWRSLGVILAVAAFAAACGDDSPGGSEPTPDENAAPSADFTASCVYMQCDFTDASVDTDGSVVAWSWNFGDGQTSTEASPVHVYAEPGNYSVRLEVTDDSSATDARTRDATANEQVTTSLTCEDATSPGGFVACKLLLEEPSGFRVVLNSSSCEAHGNVFRITEPVADTLVVDGCYEEAGQEIEFAGPFPAGTEIAAEVIAPLLSNPPALRVSGAYPEWTLSYEDGVDTDFDDLIMTVTALPVP